MTNPNVAGVHQASAKYIIIDELVKRAKEEKFGAMHEYVSMSSLPLSDIAMKKRPMNMFLRSYIILCGADISDENVQFAAYQKMIEVADSFGLDVDQVFSLPQETYTEDIDSADVFSVEL